MKVFVTKYALTRGIIEIDVVQSEESPSMVMTSGNGFTSHFHGEGRDWHRTLGAAKSHANTMRVLKIHRLKRSIGKLEAMEF